MKKIIICILAALMLFSLFGCGTQSGEQGDVIPVKLLTTGWTNTPTDENDPYRKWIRDNYKLDVDLQATADFGSAAYIAFADTQKPDIVSLPDLSQLKNFRQQGVLLDDWTPYLDKMPNVKAFMERDDQQLLKGLFTEDGKITAIWTNPNAVTWSLKIREDWAEEYRQETQPDQGYEECRPEKSRLFRFFDLRGRRRIGYHGIVAAADVGIQLHAAARFLCG